MTPAQVNPLLAAIPLPMLVTDSASRIQGVNEAAEALLGMALTGRPFVTALRQPEINAALDAVLHGKPEASVTTVVGLRGRDLPCEITVRPLLIGGRRGAAVAILDRSRDEHTEQMRRDFVANVSHELRTPLTALMGFIETLRGPARNDAAARDRFLDIMEREAGRMNRLVADLLSLSRVEQDERSRPVQHVDLATLLRGAVATLAPAARSVGVELRFEGIEGEAWVPGDADQLVQVFHNLVENGAKYGGTGGVVTLSLTHIAHEPVLRGPAWAVAVADQGEGIAPEHLPRLTERFYRVDAHRSREQGGTGLGLAIVKHIVNRHRGRLKIESEKGKGSRFTVILPDGSSRI